MHSTHPVHSTVSVTPLKKLEMSGCPSTAPNLHGSTEDFPTGSCFPATVDNPLVIQPRLDNHVDKRDNARIRNAFMDHFIGSYAQPPKEVVRPGFSCDTVKLFERRTASVSELGTMPIPS
jgi:hypothetical protein